MCEDKREIKKEMTEEIISMLKNGSCRMEILELMKLGADSIKNSTYRTLLDGDIEYRQLRSEINKAKEQISEMDLQPDQKEALENMELLEEIKNAL